MNTPNMVKLSPEALDRARKVAELRTYLGIVREALGRTDEVIEELRGGSSVESIREYLGGVDWFTLHAVIGAVSRLERRGVHCRLPDVEFTEGGAA